MSWRKLAGRLQPGSDPRGKEVSRGLTFGDWRVTCMWKPGVGMLRRKLVVRRL